LTPSAEQIVNFNIHNLPDLKLGSKLRVNTPIRIVAVGEGEGSRDGEEEEEIVDPEEVEHIRRVAVNLKSEDLFEGKAVYCWENADKLTFFPVVCVVDALPRKQTVSVKPLMLVKDSEVRFEIDSNFANVDDFAKISLMFSVPGRVLHEDHSVKEKSRRWDLRMEVARPSTGGVELKTRAVLFPHSRPSKVGGRKEYSTGKAHEGTGSRGGGYKRRREDTDDTPNRQGKKGAIIDCSKCKGSHHWNYAHCELWGTCFHHRQGWADATPASKYHSDEQCMAQKDAGGK